MAWKPRRDEKTFETPAIHRNFFEKPASNYMTSGAAESAERGGLPALKFLFTVVVGALYNVIVPHINLPRFSSVVYEFLRHDLTFGMRLDADINL